MIGDRRLFAAVTAVVVGGTALIGGESGVVNTLMDVLIVKVLGHRMVLLGVSPYVQQTVHRLMIIAAVALSLERIRQTIVNHGPVMLAARALSKPYVAIKMLKNVDFEMRRDEVFGLNGKKGAGKSILMTGLSGTVRPHAGTLTLDGEPLRLCSARDAAANEIGMMFQVRSVLLTITVAEDIDLGQQGLLMRLDLVEDARCAPPPKRSSPRSAWTSMSRPGRATSRSWHARRV